MGSFCYKAMEFKVTFLLFVSLLCLLTLAEENEAEVNLKEGSGEAIGEFCNLTVKSTLPIILFSRLYIKLAPSSDLIYQIVKTDRSNRDYLKQLDEVPCSPKEQEALRQ